MNKKELSKYFSDMGKRGAAAVLKKDPEHFKKLSAAGAAARRGKRLTKSHEN